MGRIFHPIGSRLVSATSSSAAVTMPGTVGGTRTVTEVPDPVPFSVPLWKARVVLKREKLGAGPTTLWEAIQAVASDALQEFLERGSEIERHHPSTVALGTALGLDDAQMDALFVAAAAVQPA